MDENQIKWIEDFKKITLGPGDILVIKTKEIPTEAERNQIRTALSKIFTDHQVLVLLPGMDLGVISKEE